jgi:ADP-ribose pyrophosphatase YjhB (NUDIX family)
VINIQKLKFAVSFIVYRNKDEFLVVKRPDEDKEIGGLWGLPATGFNPKEETPDQAVIRGAREKLCCEVEIKERLPLVMIQNRHGYDLLLIDYVCRLAKGQPNVNKSQTTGTKYVEQKWTSNPKILQKISEKGSICTQLFLNHLGMWPKEKFISKLD